MSDNIQKIHWPGWEVVSVIGRGSFGTVYKIRREIYSDVEEAALKVMTIPHSEDEVDYLRSGGMDDYSITQSFHEQVGDIAREYNLMRKMSDSPYIVRCDDFREIQHDDGLGWDIYIKMELLTPLMKALNCVKTERQIIQLGMDLCNALVACQEQNIVHRDIKPQNVFVSGKGQFKLGDFGIARTIERTTRATAGIGTYSYMAPEVEKNEAYGKTADIYSLGLLMYWLLNERRGPFMPLPPAPIKYGDEEMARRRRVSGERLPAPTNGSVELKRIVLKACAYNPADRYATAAEMLRDLNAAFADKSSLQLLEYEERMRKEREEQERLKKEAEERERLRREAEERERLRKEAEERERLQKEEQERLRREAEEQERQKKEVEAQEWLRREAEKRERIRKETEEQRETREAKKHRDREKKSWKDLIFVGIVVAIIWAMMVYAPAPRVETNVCRGNLEHCWEQGTRVGEWICMRCAISTYEVTGP